MILDYIFTDCLQIYERLATLPSSFAPIKKLFVSLRSPPGYFFTFYHSAAQIWTGLDNVTEKETQRGSGKFVESWRFFLL